MLAYLFVFLAVAVRFIPHPWTFTPVVGSLLFFGARGSRRALWVPLLLLVASDLVLNKFVYAYRLSWEELIIWAWYGAILWLGTNLRANSKPVRVIGAALAGSVSFFLLSDFGTFASTNLYPKTFAGLITCYIAAIPFFRNALEGDLLFTCAMFATPFVLKTLTEAFSRQGDRSAAA